MTLSPKHRAQLLAKIQQEKTDNTSASNLAQKIMDGDLAALSKGITFIESKAFKHRAFANELVDLCLPKSGKSFRIGITGVPGVGKSTFIESFGYYLIQEENKKLAVLAIDPSSQVSGGSILGDKTRMEKLTQQADVFIRPSPSADSLGGVARKTRESIILCEAAGYDTIFIETVGVGQSETEVKGMVDFFLLLMLAGAGDELQGIKRGIMEMADGMCITKADDGNEKNANKAAQNYRNALHLFPPHPANWVPEVMVTSSTEGVGLQRTWGNLEKYQRHTISNGFLAENRKNQSEFWLKSTMHNLILDQHFGDPKFQEKYQLLIEQVREGQTSPFRGAEELLQQF
ncbi:MAG: LAO/AO transport system kinase [Sphingobacteriales bacterium]|jgi:LAO/AO transport system kinase